MIAPSPISTQSSAMRNLDRISIMGRTLAALRFLSGPTALRPSTDTEDRSSLMGVTLLHLTLVVAGRHDDQGGGQ